MNYFLQTNQKNFYGIDVIRDLINGKRNFLILILIF